MAAVAISPDIVVPPMPSMSASAPARKSPFTGVWARSHGFVKRSGVAGRP
jgi:hypothetical protein